MEGKYWKRRSEAVATEYKRWRLFYKQKRSFNQRKLLQSSGEFTQADAVSFSCINLHYSVCCLQESMDATQTTNMMG